jgi:phosphoribosyl 1,2-cyclic phosphodiesterase
MSLRICSLASGSSGNATYIACDSTSLLVDCGMSAREVETRLAMIDVHPACLDGILISHSHVDHYRSAGTIHARYGVPVHADPSTAHSLVHRGRDTSWKRIAEVLPLPERIGDIEIESLDTVHGFGGREGRTVAFLLHHRDSRVGVVTDLGVLPDSIARALKGVDALILEANYDEALVNRKLSDPAYAAEWFRLRWLLSDHGHLSNRQCAEALSIIVTDRTRHVLLGHRSENHLDSRQDNNNFARAAETVRVVLRRERSSIPALHAADRIGRDPAGPSPVFEI